MEWQAIQTEVTVEKDYLTSISQDQTLIHASPDVPKIMISDGGTNIIFHELKNMLEAREYKKSLKRMYVYRHLVNAFEHTTTGDYPDIEELTTKKMNLSAPIDNRAGYKYLEMNNLFDFIPKTATPITTFHIAEAPGSFIQVTALLRNRMHKSIADKYYTITLHGAIEYDSKLSQMLLKEKPRRYFPFQTSKQPTKNTSTGDITKLHTIKFLMGGGDGDALSGNNRPALITADGGHDVKNENNQEQELTMLILGETVAAVSVCAKGGSFVLKFFDMSTKATHKIVTHILCSFFEEVHIVKPLMSRASNAERYAVAKGFKYEENDKEYKKKLALILHMFEEAESIVKRGLYVGDIFPSLPPDETSTNMIRELNTKVMELNFDTIENKYKFITGQIPQGPLGFKYQKIQEEATNFWVENNIK